MYSPKVGSIARRKLWDSFKESLLPNSGSAYTTWELSRSLQISRVQLKFLSESFVIDTSQVICIEASLAYGLAWPQVPADGEPHRIPPKRLFGTRVIKYEGRHQER